jgi:sugar phosphate isomerase/epimerase
MTYSRRDLAKAALGALTAAPAWGRLNSEVNGVLIGVQSYSFRDRSLDEALKAMQEIGLSECELYSGHVEPKTERGEAGRNELRRYRLNEPLDTFKAIRRKFQKAGINLYAYNYSFRDDFSDDEIARGFDIAKALGAKVITASSTVTCASRVAPYAEKAKMVVGMHGHDNTRDTNEFAKPESFEAAMKLSRYIGVNLDIGHFFAAGYDPVEYLRQHHDRIVTLHIKDRKKDHGPNMPFGQGDTPIKQVLQLMRTEHYKIPANIEYEYKGADTVAEVRKCLDYCKAALA